MQELYLRHQNNLLSKCPAFLPMFLPLHPVRTVCVPFLPQFTIEQLEAFLHFKAGCALGRGDPTLPQVLPWAGMYQLGELVKWVKLCFCERKDVKDAEETRNSAEKGQMSEDCKV